ncbi:MAG: tetratricopeptide repeat protein [Gemmatimonadetes bacterium]|nr:tetratricopeptide repeat protein [Gemmatimonadota bacterium]
MGMGRMIGIGLVSLMLGVGCGPEAETETATPEVQFVDVTEAVGLDFRQVSGGSEQRYILESMSSGAAFFDYDGDGYLDLFLVNSTRVEADSSHYTNRLYRNSEGTNGRVFEDKTDEAGLRRTGWGMGCAVGDYDNDGDLDLYVTYWGPNVLYRNDGGRFAEVELGVEDDGWGTSAAFGDVDADGFLDLYVANYLVFDLENPPGGGQLCSGFKGLDVYCGPHGMVPQANVIYRNEGGAVFVDVSRTTGIDAGKQASLGVVFLDGDDDGDQDLYVANDGYPNLLYRNDGHWQLTEVAAFAGAAYSEDGRAQAGMGVAAGDYDNDGDLDLYMTHFSDDVNTLYQNQGDGQFVDFTAAAGLGGEVRPYLGWSTGFFDYDNDGWLDLFAVNGHIYPQVAQHPSGLRYAQRNLLYQNAGETFVEVGATVGRGFAEEKVSRGGALGDYDNDGDLDLLIVNLNDAPTLLHNLGGSRSNWLGLELVGTESNRDAQGARVVLFADNGQQMREVQRGVGYLSQSDGRVLFGLGTAEEVERVEIRWSSGRVQVLERPETRRYLVVQEGEEGIVAGYAGPADTEDLVARKQLVEIDSRPAVPRYAAGDDQTATDHYKAGVELYRQGRYQEAIDALRASIHMQPDSLKTYYSLGIALYSGLGRAKEAAAVLEEAVARDSAWAQVYALLGAVYMDLDRKDRAIQFLKRTVALNPEWENYNRLGLAQLRSGNLTAASAAFEYAVRQAPWHPHPHLNLARIYERQGREQAAARQRQIFAQLRPVQDQVQRHLENLAAFPGDIESRHLLGEAYVAQGRIEEALATFRQVIAIDSSYAPSHYGLGAALHYKSELQAAIAAYERACQLQPDLVGAFADLGQAYHQLRDYEGAIAAYRRALALQSDLPAVRTKLGMAYAQQGDLQQAMEAFKAVLNVDSTLVEARDALAQVYAAQEQYAAAIREWEAVLRLDPRYPRAVSQLRLAREKLVKKKAPDSQTAAKRGLEGE